VFDRRRRREKTLPICSSQPENRCRFDEEHDEANPSPRSAVLCFSSSTGRRHDHPTFSRRQWADWKAAHEYDYVERDRQKGGGTKTSEELMILGSPYERLVAVNGKQLSPEHQGREQQELETTLVERRKESQQQRGERIAKYEKERESDHLLMEQLTKALDFKLMGEQKLGPYEVYVFKATPRPGYRPPNNEAKVLTGMEGKLWIDEKTFQWVKVEATVIRPVSIEGFLAEVEPGTHFELEKAPVTDSIWLPRHFAMKSQAKVLFLFTRRSQADETYSDYHKPAPIK
jgi:hypothetical protein